MPDKPVTAPNTRDLVYAMQRKLSPNWPMASWPDGGTNVYAEREWLGVQAVLWPLGTDAIVVSIKCLTSGVTVAVKGREGFPVQDMEATYDFADLPLPVDRSSHDSQWDVPADFILAQVEVGLFGNLQDIWQQSVARIAAINLDRPLLDELAPTFRSKVVVEVTPCPPKWKITGPQAEGASWHGSEPPKHGQIVYVLSIHRWDVGVGRVRQKEGISHYGEVVFDVVDLMTKPVYNSEGTLFVPEVADPKWGGALGVLSLLSGRVVPHNDTTALLMRRMSRLLEVFEQEQIKSKTVTDAFQAMLDATLSTLKETAKKAA